LSAVENRLDSKRSLDYARPDSYYLKLGINQDVNYCPLNFIRWISYKKQNPPKLEGLLFLIIILGL